MPALRKLPAGAIGVCASELADIFEVALGRGYSTSVWAWRTESSHAVNLPEMRVFFEYVAAGSTISGTDKRSPLLAVLKKAQLVFAAHCKLPEVTGLPENESGWQQAAELFSTVFTAGLERDVSVELQALLPGSQSRWLQERDAPVVAPHETFYHLRWDESLGGSHKRWLEVTASSLIEVLTKAQDLVEETCASIQAQVEADANRQARWLARRETINS